MVDWNPNTMYNDVHIDYGMDMEHGQRDQTNASGTERRDRALEQRSGSLDQSPTQSVPQRELTGATGIFPSDFAGYLLHPETIQNSNIQHGTEDMSVYYQQKQPLSVQQPAVVPVADTTKDTVKETRAPPPDYTPTPPATHEDDIMFFGDSNTTELRAKSRSTLDQDGLRRGSITTLPYASTRRRSSQQHRDSLQENNEPLRQNDDSLPQKDEPKIIKTQITPINERTQPTNTPHRKPSLSQRAYAAAAGVAAGITGAASSLFTSNKTDDGYDMSGPHFVVRDEYGPYKNATTCNHEPAMHGQEPCFKSNEDCKRAITPDHEHPFCGHIEEPILCGERPVKSLFGGIPQSQLHEPTRRTDLNDCNIHEGQVACDKNPIAVWNTNSNNPQLIVSKGIPQSQLHEPKRRTDIGDCNVNEGQVASSPTKEDQPGFFTKATTAASEMAAAASATLFGNKNEHSQGIPQSQLHEPLRRTELDGTNVHEGQVATAPQESKGFLQNWGSNDKDSNKDAATGFSNFKGIPQSELHEPIKRTSLSDSSVDEGQVASSPKKQQDQGGILSKISTGATAAASGVAAAATGAAATLFGTSEKDKSKHERPDRFEDMPPTAAVATTTAANLKNANQSHLGSVPTAEVAATSAATLKNDHLNAGTSPTSHIDHLDTTKSDLVPTAAVAATSAAGLKKDHLNANKTTSSTGSANLKSTDSGFTPTAAVAATSAAGLQKDHLNAGNANLGSNTTDSKSNADSGFAPTATVAATSAAGLKKDHLDANKATPGTGASNLNSTTSSGFAPTAAVAATSAAGLQKDHLNTGTSPTSHIDDSHSNNNNSGVAPTAAFAATSAAGLQKEHNNAANSGNKANGIVIRSQSPEQLHSTPPTTAAGPATAPNTLGKTASIPSDKSISSARAIKHGNFGHHSPEFDHVVDSTDPSFVEKRYNKRKNSRNGIKSAFRRFSRDSGSSIDKSSIVKQDDGHRLSDAEQFKQHVDPQQQYVRVPGVTAGPTEGESQFVRVDQGSSSSSQPNSEIPSRGSYVSGQIEHRRGSIQKVVGTIINSKSMKDKGESAKLSGKEKIEAYRASKEVHPNDSMPIKATNLTNF